VSYKNSTTVRKDLTLRAWVERVTSRITCRTSKMNPGARAVGHRNLDLAKMAQKGKANLIAGPWRLAHEQEMDSTERTQPKTKTLATAPRMNGKVNSWTAVAEQLDKIWPAVTPSKAAAPSQKHGLSPAATNQISQREKPRPASTNNEKYSDLGTQE
jgi:hypothetical protein